MFSENDIKMESKYITCINRFGVYDKLRNLSLDESGVSLACEALVGARVCPVDVRHDQLSGHLTITRLRYLQIK